MSEWNAQQYLQFGNQRTQPALDLIARVRHLSPKNIVDLGCGPGNSTAALRAAFPKASIVGVDNSPNMIQRARADHPDLSFALGDVTALEGIYDLLFSNACLQWIPDHETLIPSFMEHLNPGGVLAVQIPNNGDSPLFRLIREMADDPWWGIQNVKAQPDMVCSPEIYYDILSGCCSEYQLWETVYHQRMASHASLVEWVKSTRLRPYLAAMDPDMQEKYLAEMEEQLKTRYPMQKDGTVLFSFRRLFFTAVK